MADEGFPEVAAPDLLDDAEFRGYLQKKRPFKKLLSIKYQRRWCVIQNNIFYYFDGPLDRKQKGAFSLQGYRFFHLQDSDESFALVGKGKRSFEFIAPSKEEFFSWEKAVTRSASGFTDIQSKMLGRTQSIPVHRNRSFEDLYSAEKYISEKYTSEKNKQKSVRMKTTKNAVIREEVGVAGTSPRAPPPVPKIKSPSGLYEQGRDFKNAGVKSATLPPNIAMRFYEDYDQEVESDAGVDTAEDLDDYAFVPNFPPTPPKEIDRQYSLHGEEGGGYETLPVILQNMALNMVQLPSIDDDDYAVVNASGRSKIISGDTEELYITNLPNQNIPKCSTFPSAHKIPQRVKLDSATLEDDTYIEFSVSDVDPSQIVTERRAPSSSITRLLKRDYNDGSDDNVDDIYLDLSAEGSMSGTCPISEQQDVCEVDWSNPNDVSSSRLHSFEPIYENFDPNSVKQKTTVHVELLLKFKSKKQASDDVPDYNEQSSDDTDDDDEMDYENVTQKFF